MNKRYIFHYDTTQPAWKNHCKLLDHNGMECSADITDLGVLDHVRIMFDDGFEATAIVYELEEVNGG